MLVRYRMLPACTLAQFQTDINNIILGNVTNVSQLSAGGDQVNSVIYGTYPTNSYARVNGTSYTYSKTHNDATTNKTHYIRLTFDATQLTTITLAAGYTSGTDTLVNSFPRTVNIVRAPYEAFYKSGIDIIVSNKMLVFFAPNSGVFLGLIDMGHSSTTRTYADSILMLMQDFSNVPNYGPLKNDVILNNTGTTIPYIYNYDTVGYASAVGGIQGVQTVRKASGAGTSAIFENPAFTSSTGASNLIYGCYRLPFNTFSGVQIYKDGSNLYRLTINDLSLLVD